MRWGGAVVVAFLVLGPVGCGRGASTGAVDGGVDAPGVCGDGTCNTNESCALCAMDCGDCTPSCGDGTCDVEERCDLCSADCGTCGARCGDDTCDVRETCASCPHDCGACSASCGDGHCDAPDDCTSCAADCGTCPSGCDDGVCDATETCGSCQGDCGRCTSGCGDHFCDAAEDCIGCPADCGACPGLSCGDGTCAEIETCLSCEADCGSCLPFCGDGRCDVTETCSTCSGDCGACVGCGDGSCDPSESCATCPSDCSVCPGVCGDDACSTTETCAICAADCGSCAAACGDGSCDATEACDSCPSDCGACSSGCGDGACATDETCESCAVDCGGCGDACGDAACGASESCTTCPGDCGACGITCGDGRCDPGETCFDCPTDCPMLCGSHGLHTCPPTFTRPTRPARCPFPAEVVIWTQNGWNHLIDAIDADHTDCAEYWVTIPHGSPARGSAHGPPTIRPLPARRPTYAALHYMAELHWTTWSRWRRAHHASWTDVGRAFLDQMASVGYCPSAGDSWGINEVPSGARRGESVCMNWPIVDDERLCHTDADCHGNGPCQPIRDSVLEVVRTLHAGTSTMPGSRGALFIVNYGQSTRNSSEYRARLAGWLEDASFWAGVSPHVRFWAQEVYTDPEVSCPRASEPSTLAERLTRMQEFTEGPVRLVSAAPMSAVGPSRSYLGRAYMPMLNAFYGSSRPYGYTRTTLEHMQMLVTEQVVATRQWADRHPYAPDGRIAFGYGATDWDGQHPQGEALDGIAERMAAAIRQAYGPGATAMGACREGASPTAWCECSIDRGSFASPDPWDARFSTW